MPNDPPYGGQIKVNKNGSVTWAVSAREYPSYQDTNGTVEYAIRVVDKERDIITSKDGKCILQVHLGKPIPANPCSETTNSPTEHVESDGNTEGHAAHAGQSQGESPVRFLIVSGYDMPAAPENTVIVGKSYFITMNRNPDFEDADLPEYDLILQYDDYDLEIAGLPRNLEPTELHVCHENWISVGDLWQVFMANPQTALDLIASSQGAKAKNLVAVEEFFNMDLESLAIWAAVERQLRDAGVTGDLQDILEMLVESAKERRIALTERGSVDSGGTTTQAMDQDLFWVSRWHEVVKHSAQAAPCEPEDLSNDIPAQVDAVINERLIQAEYFVKTPGSRAITVKGIRGKGLFVLMYHGPSEKHSGSDH